MNRKLKAFIVGRDIALDWYQHTDSGQIHEEYRHCR